MGARNTDTFDYKDHSWWQGKIYKLEGSTKDYPNFQYTCNEGDIQGFGGANCRHIKWAFFPGISVPKAVSIDKEESDKLYEKQQKQRSYERRIRLIKNKADSFKAIGDNDNYKKYKLKYKEVSKEYNDYCKKNDLKRDYTREYVSKNKISLGSTVPTKYYEDVTEEWLKNVDTSYQETIEATSVIKNNKEYRVNETNIIEYKNKEKENGQWFVNKFGGKIEYMPTIYEDGGVSCADYKYYSRKDTKDWIYLEEKEVSGKGKNSFYHALEDKEKQSDIFLIDCTKSNLTDEEIRERLKIVFTASKTKYVKTIIVKNKEDLFGIFSRK